MHSAKSIPSFCDEAGAKRMLKLLSGRKHAVYTGVTFVFLDKNGRAGAHTFYEKTEVTMKPLSELEIDRYVATACVPIMG